MKRSSTTERLQRLEILKAQLGSGEPTTVGEIAEDLRVSVRTVSRDIQILRDQGLPIDADRGHGGGVRLHRNWGIGRINLNYSEAVDLLVSLAVAEQMDSPLLMAHLKSVRRKLMASFSPALNYKVRHLKSRIRIGHSVSASLLASVATPERNVVKQLHQAFLLQRRISIGYRSASNAETTRIIQPHYLLLCYPIWYVLAWDELRDDVRTFRCDRITAIKILDADNFKLLPVARFDSALEGIYAI